jgi:FKBP-type peptidyl-prolyl cis-trans isomerase FkpA
MRSLLILPILGLAACSPDVPPPTAAANAAYLEKASAEPGAFRTSSGLIVKHLRDGTGSTPGPTDTVKVNYRGTLVNGKEFDKSKEPISFPLNRVIPCWTEGLQKIRVGGKAQLVCPAAIGYGTAGSPPDIPGGATLIFEVELLGIGN